MSAALESQALERFPTLTTAGRDHKAWAKRFYWREQQGDKDLLAIQIKFAKMALDIKEEVAA